jgi:hypothetical protein
LEIVAGRYCEAQLFRRNLFLTGWNFWRDRLQSKQYLVEVLCSTQGVLSLHMQGFLPRTVYLGEPLSGSLKAKAPYGGIRIILIICHNLQVSKSDPEPKGKQHAGN